MTHTRCRDQCGRLERKNYGQLLDSVTDTDAVQALLDEVQHRCTARIYDADDICKACGKGRPVASEGLPEKLRTGATVYAARSGAVAKRAASYGLHGRRDWGPASSS